jgi:hypothetical protein
VLGLQQWLRSLEDAGMPLAMSLLDEGATLVERKGPAITEPGPLVHITQGKTYLDGIPVDGAANLQEELTKLIELRQRMMPESPFIKSPRCHLAIGGETPWEQIRLTVGAMSRAGIERVTFLFSDPGRTVPAPPASPIDEELSRMQKSAPIRRGQIIAELIAYVYQDCPQGLRVIANMGVNPIADFKQAILDALPEALGQCSCAPDDASVKSLHWALFGNPRPSSGLTVRIDGKDIPAVSTVAAPGEKLWTDTHALIAAASADETKQPLALALTGPPTGSTDPSPTP